MAASISMHDLPLTHLPRDTHPLGTETKVLLTSVFGPYSQDDEYGENAKPKRCGQCLGDSVHGQFRCVKKRVRTVR